MALNTAIFSAATGLSRVAGLVREIVAARYFGTSGAASAFTLAFQIPNLDPRAGRRRRAQLGLRARLQRPARAQATPRGAPARERARRPAARRPRRDLAAVHLRWRRRDPRLHGRRVHATSSTPSPPGLSQVLFPIIVLLGLNGLTVGILNAYDQFTIPAIAPLVWNVVIIAGLVALTPLFEGDDRVYAYAIGVVAGTLVQLLMTLPQLRQARLPDLADPAPAPRRPARPARAHADAAGLGRARADQLRPRPELDDRLAGLRPGAGRDRQGVPHLHAPAGDVLGRGGDGRVPAAEPARVAPRPRRRCAPCSAIGMRQIALLLVPAAAATIVLARPIVEAALPARRVRRRVDRPASRRRSPCSRSRCRSSGWNLILTRTFFSLQRPWLPTTLAVGSLVGQRRRLAGAVPDRDRGRRARHGRLERAR